MSIADIGHPGVKAALESVRTQIEAMAQSAGLGKEGPYTEGGTQYLAFMGGEAHAEGHVHRPFLGTLEELVIATVAAVREYRERVGGAVDLSWRKLPLYEAERDGGHSIYLRLAFEPAVVAEEPAPSDPISLAEERAMRASDSTLWSPADALRFLLRRIEAGEVNPERLAIHTIQRDADGGMTHGFTVAGLTFETHLCLLEIAKQRLMDDWRR